MQESALDIETRRKKQQDLMVRMVERKVRTRAKQLSESRGQTDGRELQDWFQAESEVLEKTVIAQLYRRMRGADQDSNPAQEMPGESSPACE